MNSPFWTLSEAAAYLRYEGPRANANCRAWLRSRGIRASVKRGLFRRELIERAIEREESRLKPRHSRTKK